MNQFTIILPVRNGGQHLKECIASLLAQTYEHFNIIVLDNNSNDGTIEYLLALHNEKIEIVESDKDLSITDNWARIVSLNLNNYVTLIGHDDILFPNFLETINKEIIKNPDASLYHSQFNFIDEEGRFLKQAKITPQRLSYIDLIDAIINQKIDINGTGYVFRFSDYLQLGGIPTHYPNLIYADAELWIQMAKISYIAVAQNTLFSYRIHGSTTKKTDTLLIVRAFKLFTHYLKSLTKESPKVQNLLQNQVEGYLASNCKAFAHRLLKQHSTSTIKEKFVLLLNLFDEIATDFNLKGKSNITNNQSIKLSKTIANNSLLYFLFKKIKG